MATYYLTGNDSDLTGGVTFHKELSSAIGSSGSISVGVSNSSTEESYAFTDVGIPNNAAWGSGLSFTVKVSVTSSNSSISLKVRVSRVNSSGTVQQSSSYTASQTLSSATTYTFTTPSVSFSSGSVNDRIRIDYSFTSSNQHGGAASVSIGTGTANSSVVSPVTVPAVLPDMQLVGQYEADDTTAIAVGGTSTNGSANGIVLETDMRPGNEGFNDLLVPKYEIDAVGTSFSNAASNTGQGLYYDPDSPIGLRGAAFDYDTIRKRYILTFGANGTTSQNNVYAMQLSEGGKWKWRQLATTGSAPTARYQGGGVFDAVNNRFIAVFGYTSTDTNELWAINFSSSEEGAWQLLSSYSGTAPSTRSNITSTVANDPANQCFYVFGGWGASYFNGVYKFSYATANGAWSTLSADGNGSAPSGRRNAVAVLDKTNNRLLIFSGNAGGSSPMNDLWQFSLSNNTWTHLSPTGTAPGGRERAWGEWEPVNRRMFMGGGDPNDTGNVFNEYWSLDTTTTNCSWTRLSSTDQDGQPLGTYLASAKYCVDTKQVVIWNGGIDNSNDLQHHVDMFDATETTNVTMYGAVMNHFMRPQDAPIVVWNSDENEAVSIGGFSQLEDNATIDTGGHISDVFAYDASTNSWRFAIGGSKTFTEREGVSAAYDSIGKRVIMFGGLWGDGGGSYGGGMNDTWELKRDIHGNYQIRRMWPSGTLPGGRWLGMAAFDAANNRFILTLGNDGALSNFTDVWALNLGSGDGTWVQLSPTGTTPTGVWQAGYANDTTNKKLYIVAGSSSGGDTQYTSQFVRLDYSTTNCAWQTLTSVPVSRRGMGVGIDIANGRIMAFGGYDGSNVYNDSYIYSISGNSWSSAISPGTRPGARRSAGGWFDTSTGKFNVTHGRPTSGTWFGDTWQMTPNYTTPTSSTWANLSAKHFIRGSVKATGLTNNTAYHWQGWVTDSDQVGDSSKSSFGGNAESAADFVLGTTGPSQVVKTKSLKYTVKTLGHRFTKSLSYHVRNVSAITKSDRYAVRVSGSGAGSATYYADGHLGIADAQGVWTNDANAADSNMTTTAASTTTLYGTNDANSLHVLGTNAPTSGGMITDVSITFWLEFDGTSPGSQTPFLDTPPGGWTWEAVNTLEFSVKYGDKTGTSFAFVDIFSGGTSILALRTMNGEYDHNGDTTTLNWYGVEITVTARSPQSQKPLSYNISSISSASIQKSAAYQVRTGGHSFTKSSRYDVLDIGNFTKNLTYRLRKASKSLKSLGYAVEKLHSSLKSLRYAVSGSHVKTKSLRYEISQPEQLTKASRYTVTSKKSYSKSLSYHIPSTSNASIQKSARYAVRGSNDSLTHSLTYRLTVPTATELSLGYYVGRALSVTKNSKYSVKAKKKLTKSLRVAITTNSGTNKSIWYVVPSPLSVNKTLRYLVPRTAEPLSTSVEYGILTSRSLTKAVSYAISRSATLTRTSSYRIGTVHGQAKDLSYVMLPSTELPVSLKYAIKIAGNQLTASMSYEIQAGVSLMKSLKYTLFVPGRSFTKPAAYRVVTGHAKTKSLHYEIRRNGSQTLTAAYRLVLASQLGIEASYSIRPARNAQKSLKYTVPTTKPPLEQAIRYAIRFNGGVSLDLGYRILTGTHSTKALAYRIGQALAQDKTLRYTVKPQRIIGKEVGYSVSNGSSLAKAVTYRIDKPNETTLALAYRIRLAPQTLGLAYYVIKTPVKVKGLRYDVAATQFISKAMTYNLAANGRTTRSIRYAVKPKVTLDRQLAYEILLLNSITKPSRYVIGRGVKLDKSLEYAMFLSGKLITKAGDYFVRTVHGIDKTLGYYVELPNGQTIPARYSVKATKSPLQRGISYVMAVGNAMQRALKYTVPSSALKSRDLRYQIGNSHSLTASLAYRITAPANLQKSLRYSVPNSQTHTAQLTYTLAPNQNETKLTKYTIKTPNQTLLGLQYATLPSRQIQVEIRFNTLSHTPLPYQIRYVILATQLKSLSVGYEIATFNSLQKPTGYKVRAGNLLPKSLTYYFPAQVGIGKGLKYVIRKNTVLTHSLTYRVAPRNRIELSSQYYVSAGTTVAKNLRYVVKQPESKAISMAYSIGVRRSQRIYTSGYIHGKTRSGGIYGN